MYFKGPSKLNAGHQVPRLGPASYSGPSFQPTTPDAPGSREPSLCSRLPCTRDLEFQPEALESTSSFPRHKTGAFPAPFSCSSRGGLADTGRAPSSSKHRSEGLGSLLWINPRDASWTLGELPVTPTAFFLQLDFSH